MKITSRFKDYYDGAGGFDSSCHYIRTEEIKDQKFFDICSFPHRDINDQVKEFVYVFFCGKTYIGVLIENKDGSRWYYNEKAKLAYDETRKYQKPPTGKWARYSSWFTPKEIFFKDYEKDRRHVNIELNSPIVVFHKDVYNHKRLIINANLSKFGFGSAVDPYQANQEISMFLLSDLAKELDIPVKISDKDRIKAHGFDLKTSFRKDTPPTRKQK